MPPMTQVGPDGEAADVLGAAQFNQSLKIANSVQFEALEGDGFGQGLPRAAHGGAVG